MNLLSHQVDILLEHVQGPQPLTVRDDSRRRTVSALIRASLLTTTPYASRHPTHTILSEIGRQFIAKRLAAVAEALIQAGCLEKDSVLPVDEIYRRVSAKQDGAARYFMEKRLLGR